MKDFLFSYIFPTPKALIFPLFQTLKQSIPLTCLILILGRNVFSCIYFFSTFVSLRTYSIVEIGIKSKKK